MELTGTEHAFADWEESCVPSYCHPNRLAAAVSWKRLFAAADLAARVQPTPARVLDFGSSVGEIGHVIAYANPRYDYVEQSDRASEFLQSRLPYATRVTLAEAPDEAYDWVFAIDSLEHNDDFAQLVEALATKVSDHGVLVLSGPTENRLYRLGRRVAGFSGAYHKTTIYEIEQAAERLLRVLQRRTIVPAFPLFRISAWEARRSSAPVP